MTQELATEKDSSGVFEPYLKEIKRLQRENKGLRGQIGLLRKIKGGSEAESSALEAPKVENKPPEAPKDHIVHPWDSDCKDCGGPNPEFIDETVCDPKAGGCGKHLGAIKYMPLVPECPTCHAKKFAPLRALTDEEKKLFEH